MLSRNLFSFIVKLLKQNKAYCYYCNITREQGKTNWILKYYTLKILLQVGTILSTVYCGALLPIFNTFLYIDN